MYVSGEQSQYVWTWCFNQKNKSLFCIKKRVVCIYFATIASVSLLSNYRYCKIILKNNEIKEKHTIFSKIYFRPSSADPCGTFFYLIKSVIWYLISISETLITFLLRVLSKRCRQFIKSSTWSLKSINMSNFNI